MYDERMAPDDTARLTGEECELLSNLVGVAEIAAEFGLPRTSVSTWDARRATTGFPKPIEVLRMGPIYDRREVRAWLLARGEIKP